MTVFSPELARVNALPNGSTPQAPDTAMIDRQRVQRNLAALAAAAVATDPLVSILARALNVPLRQLYAVLWRAGLVEIVD